MHNPLNLEIGVGRFGHTTRKDYPRLPRIRNPTSVSSHGILILQKRRGEMPATGDAESIRFRFGWRAVFASLLPTRDKRTCQHLLINPNVRSTMKPTPRVSPAVCYTVVQGWRKRGLQRVSSPAEISPWTVARCLPSR